MRIKLLLCLLLGAVTGLQAQEYFPKNDAVKAQENTNFTVLKNAKIYVDPSSLIQNGMLAMRNGRITAVGKNIKVPENAVVIDLKGKTVYPSFIDLYSSFGIEKPKSEGGSPYSGNPQYDAGREGYYWNDHIRPETSALENFSYNKDEAENLRKLGFGVVNTHIPDGIVRGTGMLIALNSEGTEGDRILDEESAQYLSFEKSAKSKQVYPSSKMGAMALLRQTYLDADWYAKGNADNKDLALEAFNENKNLLQIFKTDDVLDELRADKVGDEMGVQYVIVGSGKEFERLDAIKATNATFIVPVKFPDAFDMEDPYMASYAILGDMKEWNQAPANLKMLSEKKVPYTITAHNAEKNFRENLVKAVAYGLDKKDALAALTTVPAKLIGQENSLGVLKEGAWANFIVTSGDYFDKETTIYENWVQGKRAVFEDIDLVNLNGTYDVKVGGNSYTVKISGEPSKPKAEVSTNNSKIGSKINYSNNWVNLLLSSPDTTKAEYTRLSARISGNAKNFSGKAILGDGTPTTFTATRTAEASENKDKNSEEYPEVLPVTYPNMAFGFESLPKQQDVLFKNATVWTNEAEGIIENSDVLVKNGKIAAVGKNLSARGATLIDATGKHLTTGIIDEHSHLAASAVNEAGHNSSAEVQMEDVVDPNDIGIYRNLAGGVTTMQLLHGSANPIGGQSAILKMKWGASPQEMVLDNSPKFIKFALGENVKQANWDSNSRFPQTRMGVEQVFVDYFTRAREYEQLKKSGKPYRRDIEMETILEIINGERFVTAHSYVQSEINMLMKVAEQFGFNINTFTHILEGYKLADKMAEHGVGGSTFSDWWAYKYEVKDAIPQNAAIMHNAGVTVAINSDDAEMSRRLNQEAAKSVKYGDISEEEAWKFVTLNPAKLLHIDDRVGSIKEGKDADLVLWDAHPLSVYAKPEKTMIEGLVYFDLERDRQLREELEKQKNLLTTQMLKAKNNGLKTQPVKNSGKEEMHCDTL
ncbi:amidohydrolase family protein [Salinimicrobium tongyeongense]|uniref:Amidohydrolase family protein n=1 Tax=Salinimicrobium tongyeongense TaxID=2809707 RepID=A0ABY6NPV4_9FLAO|nr:amidohydrolase family protein [Salinimicrobium tongyeongense]UZH54716.1 amidohydrolase family protein [Salinimicrobium tongyeongense]